MPSREPSIVAADVGRFDVVVVGAGQSGIAAAVMASRSGHRTILVDRMGAVGGNNVHGLTGPFMPCFSTDGQVQINTGIFDELIQRMVDAGGAIHPRSIRGVNEYTGYWRYAHDHVTPFQVEALKAAGANLLSDADVELLLHALCIEVKVKDRIVEEVVFAVPDGLRRVRPRMVIDATGDAAVAWLAGAEHVKGRESDGRMMPMTLFCRIAGVDPAEAEASFSAHPADAIPWQTVVADSISRGVFPIPAKRMLDIYAEPGTGLWRLNMTKIVGLDGTRASELTRAQIEGLTQVRDLVRFLQEEVRGFEQCYLVDTAPQVYVRETRRIRGHHVLTGREVAGGMEFLDAIAYGSWPIDIPQDVVEGTGTLTAERGGPTVPNWHTVPLRSLIPLDLDNLFVPGRALSATHEAAAAVRVEPISSAMGSAAGVAAALGIDKGQTASEVSAAEVRDRLAASGHYMGRDAA